MKQDCCFTRFFKSLLNVIKKDRKVKKKKISKDKIRKPLKKVEESKVQKVEPQIKETKTNNTNMQMPAPWSKVEKYKRIKKDFNY